MIILYNISLLHLKINFSVIISNKKFRNLEYLYKKRTAEESVVVVRFYSNFT